MNKLVGFTYNKDGKASNYIYRRNLQGDIIGIYDSLGNEVGGYAYDAYGKCYVKYKDNSSEEEKTILNTNPFRYRDLLLKNNSKFKKSWNHVKRHVKKSLPMNQAQKIYRSRYALSTK